MTLHYQFAGFPDKDGHLGRPVPAGKILVPEKIWLQSDSIRWRMGVNPRLHEVSRSMLNQFIRLSDGESVLRFAQAWGVLALSEEASDGHDPDGGPLRPGREFMTKGTESVAAWQYYSSRARALLNVAAAVKLGKLGDVSDLGEFALFHSDRRHHERDMQWVGEGMQRHRFGLGFSVLNGTGPLEERIEATRHLIASEIRAWLDCWKISRTNGLSDFALYWTIDNRWELQIDYHGLLFPAIALQLALVLADAPSLYTCSGCGIPYTRPRKRKKPKSGWANYCEQCSGSGVAQRRAAETYREKRWEAIRLDLAGNSVSQIAEQLNAEPARVRKWLEKKGTNAQKKTRK